jgi:hypothetical protein
VPSLLDARPTVQRRPPKDKAHSLVPLGRPGNRPWVGLLQTQTGLYPFLRPTRPCRFLGDGLSLTGGEPCSSRLPAFKTALPADLSQIVGYSLRWFFRG